MAAGNARSVGFLAVLAGAALLQPVACGPRQKGTPVSKTVRAALADVWPEVIAPELDELEQAAAALEQSTANWAGDPANAGAQAQAQLDWGALMTAWQRAEVHQIGPAASSLTAVGGQDIRDEIYSWPAATNPCRVDQETVEEAWDAPDFFDVELVNVAGLDALEVLLFAGEDNHCPGQIPINADGTWDAIGPAGIQALRARYASAAAAEVAADVARIREAWQPSGGDFATDLAEAGETGSVYESAEAGLNAILDALFYIEIATKDAKLAEPLGLADCGSTDCLAGVETRLAGGSHVWIASNLEGFRALWTGGEGTGLDDVLRDAGEDALADDVLAALDGADAAAAVLAEPVDVAAQGDPSDALALHAAIAELTTLLKGDVATVLLLQLPDEAAGDND